jgi:hypothetical protein
MVLKEVRDIEFGDRARELNACLRPAGDGQGVGPEGEVPA